MCFVRRGKGRGGRGEVQRAIAANLAREVHGALAFCHDHKREIDTDMRRGRQAFSRAKRAS